MNQITATFGRPSTRSNRFEAFRQDAPAQSNQQGKRPKAKFWANIGYETGHEKYPFVSAVGAALYAEDKRPVIGNNEEHKSFLTRCNQLHDFIMEQAAKLAPGETTILEVPLKIQLRHISEEDEPVAEELNSIPAPSWMSGKPAAEPAATANVDDMAPPFTV